MCIRDSSTPGVGAPVVAEDATAASPRPVQTLQELYAELLRCLLYTSDAADDLLCVDLGGRRIIKKKKPDPSI